MKLNMKTLERNLTQWLAAVIFAFGLQILARLIQWSLVAVFLFSIAPATGTAAWQPTQPVEIIVPEAPGSSADHTARLIQKIVAENKLMPQPLVVTNEPVNFATEGLKSNMHQLVVTFNVPNPAAIAEDFNWKILAPIRTIALDDEFVLWVHTDSPYHSLDDYLRAARTTPRKFKIGETGSKAEVKLVTKALEQAAKVKFDYVAKKSGHDAAHALATKQVDAIVNNSAETFAFWRAGKVRPLAVYNYQRASYRKNGILSWNDISTIKEQDYDDVEYRDTGYQMLRGIFAAPGISEEARHYYAEVMKKVTEAPEWKEF